MTFRSGIGLVLLTWVTAAATLLAGWRAPGPGCACAAPVAKVAAGCCCSPAKEATRRQCCPPPPSCCEHAPPVADGCHCLPALPEPAAPVVPARSAADVDELGPLAHPAADGPGSEFPPAGHPAFGSRAHPAPPPPIDLTISLSRLTC